MPMHLAAFNESQDSATLVNVAAVADPIVRSSGDDIYVPRELPYIVGLAAIGQLMTRAQLRAPSMGRLFQYEITPIDMALEPSSPQIWHDHRFSPIQLAPTEALNAQASESGAAAERMLILVLFADRAITPIEGDIRTLRFTGTTTLVANGWSNVQLVADQQLQAGEYEVVGMRAESAGAIAARLILPGSIFRPGVLAVDAQSDQQYPAFRKGGYGSLGRFFHDTIPSVDFLSVSADTAEVVYLDLIQRSTV